MAIKKRPGRQKLAGGRVKFTTTLPAAAVREIRKIGQGNASAGILQLLDDREELDKREEILDFAEKREAELEAEVERLKRLLQDNQSEK